MSRRTTVSIRDHAADAPEHATDPATQRDPGLDPSRDPGRSPGRSPGRDGIRAGGPAWSAGPTVWDDRQARVFAPPYGQQPAPGPLDAIAARIDTGDVGDRADDPFDDRFDDRPHATEVLPSLGSREPVATGRVSPSAWMAAAAGAVLVAWAVVALVRAGLARPLRTPVVVVGGFTTTAILALIVLGAGALLVLAAATRRRAVVAVVGLLVSAAAIALATRPDFGDGALAAERDFAIAVAILSGLTTAVALVADDVVRVRRADRRRHEADMAAERRAATVGVERRTSAGVRRG